MSEAFDDAPQWYWAAGNRSEMNADDRFVVASGQRELWSRVRFEISPEERCSWMSFGPQDGSATLADCLRVLMTGREMYGANLNRVLIELAQVNAFARFVRDAPTSLCNIVSNPVNTRPLTREGYTPEAEERLGRAVEETLGLTDSDWRS